MLMQAILSRQPWIQDPKVVDLPWSSKRYEEVISRAHVGHLDTYAVLARQETTARRAYAKLQKYKKLSGLYGAQ